MTTEADLQSLSLSSPSVEEPKKSKKAAKKEAAKAEKLLKRQQFSSASPSSVEVTAVDDADDLLGSNYGDVPILELQSKTVTGRKWTVVESMDAEMKDHSVLVRGRAQTIRAVGKNIAFVVLRERGFTIQCILTAKPDFVSKQMVKFAAGISRESIVDIEGVVSVPEKPITGASQQVNGICMTFQWNLDLLAEFFVCFRLRSR